MNVQELTDKVVEAVATLEDTLEPSDIPPEDLIRQVIPEVFTDRGGRLRRRASLPKAASGAARGLVGSLKWHASGGDLTGLFIAKMNAGDAFPAVETIAIVLLTLSGARSSAVDAWRRTGLFGIVPPPIRPERTDG